MEELKLVIYSRTLKEGDIVTADLLTAIREAIDTITKLCCDIDDLEEELDDDDDDDDDDWDEDY